MLTLSNQSTETINVAVNKWADGDTSFFKVIHGSTEKWPSRGDENGFVMAIKFDNNVIKRYYVKANSVITVEVGKVKDGVNTINPVG
jgi:hypothetical protein